MDEMEKAIEKVVDDYGAPENVTEEIKNFLFESGNIHFIREIILEHVCK